MRPARAAAAGIAVVGAILAQDPALAAAAWERTPGGHFVRVAAVPSCAAEAVAVLWPNARRADAAEMRALAVAVAMHRAAAADAVLPTGHATNVDVGDTHSLFVAVLPEATRDGAAAWFAALGTAAAGDVAVRSLARAALAADDAQWLYPGEILLGRARRVLAAGTPGGCDAGGSPTWLQGLSADALAALLAAPPPEPLRAVVVGNGTGAAALRAALDRIAVRTQAPLPAAASAVGGLDEPCTPHPRVDAAYVAAALRAPVPSAATVSFALAMEVLRARAEVRFRAYRGNEAGARAPFVGYQFLLGEPVVLCCRRGPAGQDAQVPRAELQELLEMVRREPPTRTEVRSAAGLLLAEWAVPPWTPAREAILRQLPAGLGPRARTLCLLGHWGIDDATVHSVPGIDPAEVADRLGDALRAGSVWWGGLQPAAAPLFPR